MSANVTGFGSLGIAGSTPTLYQPPYTLTRDVVLSEDYYPLTLRKVDKSKDLVVAYNRNDGEAEALLLERGAGVQGIMQVHRDPSKPGGWAATPVPNTAGATDMVAGMGRPSAWTSKPTDPKVLHLWYRQSDGKVRHTVQQNGTWTAPDAALDWPTKPHRPGAPSIPLQLSYTTTGDLLAYCVQDSTQDGGLDAKLYCTLSRQLRYVDALHGNASGTYTVTGTVTGFEYAYNVQRRQGGCIAIALVNDPTDARTGQVAIELWVPPRAANNPKIGISRWFTVMSKGYLDDRKVANGNSGLGSLDPKETVVSVDYAVATDEIRRLAVLKTDKGKLLALTYASLERVGRPPDDHWSIHPVPTLGAGLTIDGWEAALSPSVTKSVTNPSSPLLELFMQGGEVTYVVRQVDQHDHDANTLTPIFYPPVPLQTGVATVATQAGLSAGNELIVVSTEGTLRYLVRDPVSGSWTGSDIHLPHEKPLQVSTYRVRLTLTDKQGRPVVGAKLSVATHATQVSDSSGKSTVQASPATALINGQAYQLSSTATTISTAADGTAVLALIATGLSAPPLDITTAGLQNTVVVYPSGPVNAYLGGTGTLNMLPQMGSETLKKAKNSDGTPLAPGASRTTNGQSNADLAVTVLSGVATAGAQGTLSGTQRTPDVSATLGIPPTQLQATLTIGGVQVSLAGIFDDIVHGIKTGAAKVKSVAFDAATKLITITGDFVTASLNFVVHTIEDAANVFHSVINFLDAKISQFLDWLKAQILSVIRDAVAVAKTFDKYTLNLCDFAQKQIKKGKGKTDAWFTQQENNIKLSFTILADKIGNATLTSLLNQSTLQASQRQDGPMPVVGATAADLSSAGTGAHGQWLLDKIRSLAPDLAQPIQIPANLDDKFTDVKNKFAAAGSKLEGSVKGIIQDIQKILDSIKNNPKDISSKTLSDIIKQLGTLVDGLFTVAEAIIDLVFDLLDVLFDLWKQVLKINMKDLPLIGALITAVDPSFKQMTVGQFGALTAAFPFVIAWRIKHGADANMPFTTLTAASRDLEHREPTRPELDASVPTGDAWNILYGITTILVGYNDLFAASYSFPTSMKGIPGFGDGPPTFCQVFGIVLPALLLVCAYPNADQRGVFQEPDLHDDASVMKFVYWILGVVPPILATFGLAVGKSSNEVLKKASVQMVNVGLVLYGMSAIVVGSVRNGLNNEKNAKIWAITFTSCLGYIAYFLLTPPFRDSPAWGELAQIVCIVTIWASAIVTAVLVFITEPY